jgi:hypothetical protein
MRWVSVVVCGLGFLGGTGCGDDGAGRDSDAGGTVRPDGSRPADSGPVDPGSLPEGDTGIAARYPGDVGIADDPSVIFADDFEATASPSDLRDRWDVVWNEATLRVAEEPENVNAGARAIEMIFPRGGEVGNGLMKHLTDEREVLFLRFHSKFDPALDITGAGSFHNGGSISAHYHVDGMSTPGVRADGTNKFLVSYEATVWSGPPPGHLIAYVYHPGQRDDYGDIFFPNGEVMPNTSLPGDFGDDFVARPNVTPELGRWHAFELMVRANTPGARDGRIAMWLDGRLIADFPNMRFRDVDTLLIDYLNIGGYINPNDVRENRLWFDDVVAATSYIGPRL